MGKIPRRDRDRAYTLRKKKPSERSEADEKFLAEYDELVKASRGGAGAAKKKKGPAKKKKPAANTPAAKKEEIAKAVLKAERAEERLAAVRREFNAQVAEEKVAFKGIVEAPTGEQYNGDATKHLRAIQKQWQAWEEAEAGRKAETHLALEEQRRARKRVTKLAHNILQLELPNVK